MKKYGALDNYIEMYREQAGLSREELSVLIDVNPRSTVWRYEGNQRSPDIEKLLALEIVFGLAAHEIYAGIAADMVDKVASRAQALLEGLTDKDMGPGLSRKIATLSRLARPDELVVIPICEGE